jgi:hypothetical protein
MAARRSVQHLWRHLATFAATLGAQLGVFLLAELGAYPDGHP